MEKILFLMSSTYLQNKKLNCLKAHGDYVQKNEFQKGRKSLNGYAYYSEKYDIIRELFWKKYNMNYERVKKICTREC